MLKREYSPVKAKCEYISIEETGESLEQCVICVETQANGAYS